MGDRRHAAGDASAPRGSSPPTFTAPLRGLGRDVAQIGRRADEASVTLRAVPAVARVPGLRRVAGAIPRAPVRASVAARDPDAVLASPLYERLVRLRGAERYRRLRGRVAPEPVVASGDAAASPPPAPPRLGPWASREVDAALDLLRRVPFDELQRRGWHFQPNHFYWPLNDVAFLRENPDLWHERGLPRGIDWDIDAQVELARTLAGSANELADVQWEPDRPPTRYAWSNGAFGG